MNKFIKHIAKTGKYFGFYISYQWRSGKIPNAENLVSPKYFWFYYSILESVLITLHVKPYCGLFEQGFVWAANFAVFFKTLDITDLLSFVIIR